MTDEQQTQEERDAAAAIIEAFKRKLQQEQEAKPKNPLLDSATRFPPRQ